MFCLCRCYKSSDFLISDNAILAYGKNKVNTFFKKFLKKFKFFLNFPNTLPCVRKHFALCLRFSAKKVVKI